MNGNSSAQLEAAEMRTLVVGKPGESASRGQAMEEGSGKLWAAPTAGRRRCECCATTTASQEQQLRSNLEIGDSLGQLLKSALLIDVECCGFGYDIWYQNTTNNPSSRP